MPVRLDSGTWLPRSPRSESAAHVSARLLAAFYTSATDKIVDPLGGGVTGKRVAARQLLLGEFGLGSVSMRSSGSEGLKPEDISTNSFLAAVRELRR